MAFASYQDEIYRRGLAGENPELPITFADLEVKAAAAMPPSVCAQDGHGDLASATPPARGRAPSGRALQN